MNKTSIKFNRAQIGQLIRIFEHFKDIEHFTINSSNDNGIGPAVSVSFTLFGDSETKVDITDYKSW